MHLHSISPFCFLSCAGLFCFLFLSFKRTNLSHHICTLHLQNLQLPNFSSKQEWNFAVRADWGWASTCCSNDTERKAVRKGNKHIQQTYLVSEPHLGTKVNVLNWILNGFDVKHTLKAFADSVPWMTQGSSNWPYSCPKWHLVGAWELAACWWCCYPYTESDLLGNALLCCTGTMCWELGGEKQIWAPSLPRHGALLRVFLNGSIDQLQWALKSNNLPRSMGLFLDPTFRHW